MRKYCKFCKYGYPVYEKSECYVNCYLNHFGYPVKKYELDICEDFEEDKE